MAKRKITTKNITLYGLLMALVVISTMLFSVPSVATQGYINLGDGFVLLSGLIFGPIGGLIVGGVGSALADVLLGYAYYAPYTLVIKGLEGFIGVFIYKKLLKERHVFPAMVIAGVFMALGYFVVEIFLYGYPAAILDIGGNLLQGFVGAVVSTLIYKNIKNHIKIK